MKLSTLERKKYRIRNKLKKVSNENRYRLSVSRSSKNISAQIIDDVKKITIISASSLKKELKSKKNNKTELEKIVEKLLKKKEKKKKITKVYFDRGIYKYHGRVKTFAETLRKNGLEF